MSGQIRSYDEVLKQILTEPYCGIALGYQEPYYVIYQWGDAPVSTEIIARGLSIADAIHEYEKWKEKNFTPTGKRRKYSWRQPYAES